MKKLFCAGCIAALATLAGCTGDSSSTPQTSTKAAAASAVQPVKLTTSPKGVVQQQTPRAVKADLQGSFQSAVMVHRNADGSFTTECHDEEHGAEAFMAGATPTQIEVK